MVKLIQQNYKENKKIYNQIEKALKTYLGTNIPITHVGSTAIPNMYGKNIIDILIGANDYNQMQLISKVLEDRGYIQSKKNCNEAYKFFASTNKETSSGDIHIHLALLETERYLEFILIKEYLLKNKKEAKKYSNFKKEIIQKGIMDRKEYKKIKSEYIKELLKRAKY